MIRHKGAVLYREERMWFFAALALLVFVFAAYMYFVSASVVHVVMRKEVSQEIAEVSSYVSQLEAQYIEAQHTVSANVASLNGFVRTDAKVFIDSTDTTLVLRPGGGS